MLNCPINVLHYVHQSNRTQPEIAMRLNKPSPDTTIRLTARNVETGESKTTTIYDTTPEAVIAAVEALATDAPTDDDHATQSAKPAEADSKAGK